MSFLNIDLFSENEENFVKCKDDEQIYEPVYGEPLGKQLRKCGEIFISLSDDLIFKCGFCVIFFREIDEFTTHIKCCHLTIYNNDPLESNYHENESLVNYENDTNLNSLNSVKLYKSKLKLKSKDKSKRYKLQLDPEPQKIINKSSKKKFHNQILNSFQNVRPEIYQFDTSNEHKEKQENLSLEEMNPDLESKQSCNINRKKVKHQILNSSQNIKIENDQAGPLNNKNLDDIGKQENTVSVCSEFTENCEKLSKTDQIAQKNVRSQEKLFQCEFCERCFKTKTQCTKHESGHNSIKPHQCETCGKIFKHRTYLYAHIRRHVEKKRFKCSYCEKMFLYKSYRKDHEITHMRNQMKDTNYVCKHCGKVCFSRFGKEEHERSHTGEKPYQCSHCGECFVAKSGLHAHTRRHHTNKKAFKCEHCDMCFFTNAELKRHVVKHSDARPFVCDVCNASFPRKKALQSHIKIHSDVAGYVCKICGNAYKQYSGLHAHMKSHGQKLVK